jgi:hypothetical protein
VEIDNPKHMENQTFNTQEYITQTSLLLNLKINQEYQQGVIKNFENIKNIAELVNNFPLPEEIEIAPIFEP